MTDTEYFDDYYDEEGNLHIDGRKKNNVVSRTINKVLISKDKYESVYYTPNKRVVVEHEPKLIIHHCNLID